MAEGTNEDMQQRPPIEDYLKLSRKVKRPRESESKASKRSHITSKYHTPITELSLEGRSMTSLQNLPTLLELRELNLSDNALESGLEELFENTPKLVSLDLTGNKFSEITNLAPLTKLTKLEQLAVFDCPLTTKEKYRSQIYELLPNLKYLDGFDKDGKQMRKNSNGNTSIESPRNSQDNSKLDTSNEDGNDTKIYKQFLQEQLSNDDETDDDEFDPDKVESDENGNQSRSTSGADSDKNTSTEVSNSEGGDSNSETDSGTYEPTSKRTRIEPTTSEEKKQ